MLRIQVLVGSSPQGSDAMECTNGVHNLILYTELIQLASCGDCTELGSYLHPCIADS